MLIRNEARGPLFISQLAHSWVAGQLALNWGNARMGVFEPAQDVYLAAALHDIGFLDWESAPTLNAQTGLPHSFRDLPAAAHFGLWSGSARQMMRFGRYVSLLVSLHFSNLAQNHRLRAPAQEQEMKRRFLVEQEAHRTELLASLRDDGDYSPFVLADILERNSRLLAVWDWMSLAVCLGVEDAATMDTVPAAGGLLHISIRRKDALRLQVEPWPFKGNQPLRIVCEGRRLEGTFSDEAGMREALRQAPAALVKIELVP